MTTRETYCIGCDQTGLPVMPFLVTHHDDSTEVVRYCRECASLAAIDWNGETAAITPAGD